MRTDSLGPGGDDGDAGCDEERRERDPAQPQQQQPLRVVRVLVVGRHGGRIGCPAIPTWVGAADRRPLEAAAERAAAIRS